MPWHANVMASRPRPELVIGLVAPLGVDLDRIYGLVAEALAAVGYDAEKLIFGEELPGFVGRGSGGRNGAEHGRVEYLMDRAAELRAVAGGGAVAVLSENMIQESRKRKTGSPKKPFHDHAYVLLSVKHPAEVENLRRLYGKSFWLISAHLSLEGQIARLAGSLGSRAEGLIRRDYHDDERAWGHDVRGTFQMGDFFVNAADWDVAREQIGRYIEIMFGNTYHTPYADEYGMFLATASARRSSSLSRQVGAVITDAAGAVVSAGTNDVPKAGGGMYEEGGGADHREFARGYDSNHAQKLGMLRDMLARLGEEGWLAAGRREMGAEGLLEAALRSRRIRGMRFMGLTEYGREVHAEMAALVDAARRGIPVDGCTMYCTTFPCHMCAKHIVASGIGTLVYHVQYPKSYAADLFVDSISVGDWKGDKVHFRPHFNVSPNRYMDLFSMLDRKDESTGRAIPWNGAESMPRLWEPKEFHEEEDANIENLIRALAQKGVRRP